MFRRAKIGVMFNSNGIKKADTASLSIDELTKALEYMLENPDNSIADAYYKTLNEYVLPDHLKQI